MCRYFSNNDTEVVQLYNLANSGKSIGYQVVNITLHEKTATTLITKADLGVGICSVSLLCKKVTGRNNYNAVYRAIVEDRCFKLIRKAVVTQWLELCHMATPVICVSRL